jgi:myosin heavy subunit
MHPVNKAPNSINSDDSIESIESFVDEEILIEQNITRHSRVLSLNELKQLETDVKSLDFSLEKQENDDLVRLNNLNETSVLEQLKLRFSQNKIYTYIGDILIALNPLKALGIYGKRVSEHYQTCENIRANLPPHVYATAEQCFREMIRTQQSQCILISGESGSGKTETCKYLVQHLLNRTKPFEICLNKKIEEVNHILEAFGNAKTRINDNSSRFGKYLEIYFEQDGTVVGAKFKEYLLEKSRVVYQNEYESTFHIFSLLFAGLSGEEKLRYNLLRPPKQYRFLSNASLEGCCVSNENEERFLSIKKSLMTIGFTEQDIANMMKILVCILLIGEIQFVQKKGNNNDAVQVKNKEIIHNGNLIVQDFIYAGKKSN